MLKTDRNVTRSDIVKRHYLTYNDYYVTCHYPLSNYDIQRIPPQPCHETVGTDPRIHV